MTIRLLSRLTGVAYSTVYNLFTGRKSIRDASAETVRKLSSALGMSMDEFYNAMLEPERKTQEAPICNFTLMWRDEPVTDLMIKGNRVLLERYSTCPAKQLFHSDKISLYELGEIVRTRCWEENRADLAELLRLIGLETYDPYAIVRKTHGMMAQDPIWFRFEGEKLTYREVRRINIVEGNRD
jgi:Helix-turn-helix.